MRILSLAIAAALAVPLAFTGVAAAAPASGIIVGDISEAGPTPRHPDDAGAALVSDFGQLNPNTGTIPSFELAGSSTIFGTIAHQSASNFKDAWEMTITKVTSIVFGWQPHDLGDDFDGTFKIEGNGTSIPLFTFGGTTFGNSMFIASLNPGTYNFTVDATAAGTAPQEGHWKVNAVVPLPAGGILLLTALGGLAAFRARKKA